MNKFAAIILLAFVAVASAASLEDTNLINIEDPETQMSLTPSNEEETAGLVGDATLFSDFCIKSRDYVIGDIKHQTNALAATIFSMFFKSAESIGQDALNAESAAVAEQTAKIQEAQAQPQTYYQAVVSTVGATANSVSQGVVSKLDSLKGVWGLNKVFSALSSVCDQIAHYEEQNKAAFADFAKVIAAKDATLGATPFENVACLTTRRISRLDGVCKFSAVAQGPVAKIMKSVA